MTLGFQGTWHIICNNFTPFCKGEGWINVYAPYPLGLLQTFRAFFPFVPMKLGIVCPSWGSEVT